MNLVFMDCKAIIFCLGSLNHYREGRQVENKGDKIFTCVNREIEMELLRKEVSMLCDTRARPSST